MHGPETGSSGESACSSGNEEHDVTFLSSNTKKASMRGKRWPGEVGHFLGGTARTPLLASVPWKPVFYPALQPPRVSRTLRRQSP